MKVWIDAWKTTPKKSGADPDDTDEIAFDYLCLEALG